MSTVDKVFSIRRDEPMIKVKAWQDVEKSFHVKEFPGGNTQRCAVFREDYERCADGLNLARAKVECKLELEDLIECVQCNTQFARQKAILQQRDKLIKEGKYKAPPFPEC